MADVAAEIEASIPEEESPVPGKEEVEECLTAQEVAEIAAAAHCPDEAGEDDEHTDLPVSFPARHPSFRRKGSIHRSSSGTPGLMRVSGSGMDAPPAPLSRSFSHQQAATPGGEPRLLSSQQPSRLTRHRSMRARMAPGRSVSTDSLRGFRRDLVQNTPIASRDGMFDRKDRAIRRTRSGDDFSVSSDLDSCFTTDSINLRKSQLIADPIEGYYNDLDSCADHESIYGTMSYDNDFDGYSEYAAEEYRSYQKSDLSVDDYSFCTMDSSRMNRMQVHQVLDDVSFLRSNSFSTLASGDGVDLADISDDEEEELVDEDPTEKEEDRPEITETTESSKA